MKNRRGASVVNSAIAVVGQFVNLLFSFISRTIFIKILGEDYLGLNGLFTNLLSILSFAELGIGSAIVFSLYKPLSDKNIVQIKSLMNLYKKCYYIVALILSIGGGIVLLFLPHLIAGKYNVGNIYIAFILYLSNSVLSYLWSYKRSIFVADQLGYINSLNQLMFNAVMQVIQIVFLFLTKSYYIYLIIQIVFTVLSNIQISRKANKRFPYLKEKNIEPVNASTLSYLKKNVVGMISSKLGGVIVYGTDNLLLSSFIGLTAVGQYSNYMLIVNGVTSLINQGLGAVTSSIGNLRVSGSRKKQIEIFFQYSQVVSYVSFFISIFMATFFSPFISFWVGKKFILNPILSFFIVISFFVTSLRYSNLNFMNAYGTYWEMRYKSIIEALFNLIVSFVLIKFTDLGILSVVIGTLLANLFVNSWWEPFIVLKVAIKTKLNQYIRFYAISLLSGTVLIFLIQNLYDFKNLNVLLAGMYSLLVSLMAFYIYHVITILFAFPKGISAIRIGEVVKLIKKLRRK